MPDDLIISAYKRIIGRKGGRPIEDASDPKTADRRKRERERVAAYNKKKKEGQK